MAEVPKAVFFPPFFFFLFVFYCFKEPQFSVLVGRKDCWTSRLDLVYWPFLLAYGEEKTIYWNKEWPAPTPASCSFSEAAVFQESRAGLLFPRSLWFWPLSSQIEAFIFEYFHFSYSMKSSPNKKAHPVGFSTILLKEKVPSVMCWEFPLILMVHSPAQLSWGSGNLSNGRSWWGCFLVL